MTHINGMAQGTINTFIIGLYYIIFGEGGLLDIRSDCWATKLMVFGLRMAEAQISQMYYGEL